MLWNFRDMSILDTYILYLFFNTVVKEFDFGISNNKYIYGEYDSLK